MYEFVVNGILVTREEFKEFFTSEEMYDNLDELMDTGSVIVDGTFYEIREVKSNEE